MHGLLSEKDGHISRRILEVKGIVQGVGFRPFVFQIAGQHGLHGWVINTSAGVYIEVEGQERNLQAFIADLRLRPPPLAQIDAVFISEAEPAGYRTFEIRPSETKSGEYVSIAADVCTCADCRRELTEMSDRRYGYPFINCTNCGPRFSIMCDIPYDRTRTSMHHFLLCEACTREYNDPGNRRFHAQPNACPDCGPRLTFMDGKPPRIKKGDPIGLAVQALSAGKIIAIKGLGGFHLACNACDEAAVEELRRRKQRYGKPLVVMMENLEQAGRFCSISAAEEKLLASLRRPAVILSQCQNSGIASCVAAGLPTIGVMLPYTPVHFLLLARCKNPLVMTSGNISGEPLISANEEALACLNGIADGFLLHDRDIVNKIDDSVTRLLAGREAVIRRARGYAPEPVLLPEQLPEIIGCGPEQKNTFCLTRGCHAFVSQHIGDLKNLSTFAYYEQTIDFYKRIFRINPQIAAHDLHPSYLSTQYAQSMKDVCLIGVQHHHAHIAGCMLENGLNGPVIGLACDGTGYGTDGNLWGGELLLADYRSFTRLGHLKYVRMPGGEKAIRQPYRMAFGYLYSLYGPDVSCFAEYMETIAEEERILMAQQMDRQVNAPLTSSCGRLCDAVAAMLNIGRIVSYEGEAAVRLEAIIEKNVRESYDFTIQEHILDPAPMLKSVYHDVIKGVLPSIIAAKFHNTLINGFAKICEDVAGLTGVKEVCLSGGVFQNAYLLEGLVKKLTANGLHTFWPQKTPAGDAGISLGQVIVAHYNSK